MLRCLLWRKKKKFKGENVLVSITYQLPSNPVTQQQDNRTKLNGTMINTSEIISTL